MRRLLVLMLTATAVAGAALGARRLRPALAGLEQFRVTAVELEGARYLTLEEAVEAAAVPPDASVWDDRTPWVEALRSHPLVSSARIRRRLPGTLVLVVEEREPVALVPTPTLEPVDVEGRVLPVDPLAHQMDLPLLRVDLRDLPRVRLLTGELARLGSVDPAFLGGVSEVSADDGGELRAVWGVPMVTFRFRVSAPSLRFREGMQALSDAVERLNVVPTVVDLRWADQVVVGFR